MDNLRVNALDSVSERIEKFEAIINGTEELSNIDLPESVIANYLGIHPSSMSRARKSNANPSKKV